MPSTRAPAMMKRSGPSWMREASSSSRERSAKYAAGQAMTFAASTRRTKFHETIPTTLRFTGSNLLGIAGRACRAA